MELSERPRDAMLLRDVTVPVTDFARASDTKTTISEDFFPTTSCHVTVLSFLGVMTTHGDRRVVGVGCTPPPGSNLIEQRLKYRHR